jgi:hypothetical protein
MAATNAVMASAIEATIFFSIASSRFVVVS